jgi:deoxycytidylate deaminase
MSDADTESDILGDEHDCELVIGLVAAVGTELDGVEKLLRELIELAGYQFDTVTISEEIIGLVVDVPTTWKDKFERYQKLMTLGNDARKLASEKSSEHGNAVLAYGAASKIMLGRSTDKNGATQPHGKRAFLIRSLKRPEEVDALRKIYPQGFVLIGVHAEEERRRNHLVQDLGMTDEQAAELIRRDGEESKVAHGQRVNRTFHLADFFVRLSSNTDVLREDIRRMVELWFGCPDHTPTFDEFAMHFAYAAALRSADLSRQVGAVIARHRQVLSTGANDCPRAGGGLYWPERSPKNQIICDAEEGRDYKRGRDSNRAEQIEIIKDVVAAASNALPDLNIVDRLSLTKALEKSRISDLTEYGRVVHAEMEAMLACSRTGISCVGADLYSTTFPCHNCAKHIIAAGICRVVYIEPYAKSKAQDFHNEAICFGDRKDGDDEKVLFEPFSGIGPRRFFDLFSMKLSSGYDVIRKNGETGEKMQWDIKGARLRIQMKPISYLDTERRVSNLFTEFRNKREREDDRN